MHEYLFSTCFCGCECILYINHYAVVHFSMRDIFYSKYLYVISAAHGKGATPISLPVAHQNEKFHPGNC